MENADKSSHPAHLALGPNSPRMIFLLTHPICFHNLQQPKQ